MSLVLREIELVNFRKFRDPLFIQGLQPGLNTVIEPNEAGKSTLLAALRAALFVRHGVNSNLTRSFMPAGDVVSPTVRLSFELPSGTWQLRKNWLRGSSAELTGPTGSRLQNEAAEEKLQALFGFERDRTQGGDNDLRGALGLLWMEQTTGLEVATPGHIVQNAVRTAVEREVGTITGGERVTSLRSRIDRAREQFLTSTGLETGSLKDLARQRDAAAAAAEEARADLAKLGALLDQLTHSQEQLRILERDLGDPTDDERRTSLEREREAAREADNRLAIIREKYGRAKQTADQIDAEAERATRLQSSLAAAEQELANAAKALAAARQSHAPLREKLSEAAQSRSVAETKLKTARDAVTGARAALQTAQRARGLKAARDRYARLQEIEAGFASLQDMVAADISPQQIAQLEQLENAWRQSEAERKAGATTLAIEADIPGSVRVDGVESEPGERLLTRETLIEVAGARLTFRPPAGGEAADERAAASQHRLKSALEELDVVDVSAARRRSEAANAARAELKAAQTGIQDLCIPDERIGLAAGADALRALMAATADEQPAEDTEDSSNLSSKEAAQAEAELAYRESEGAHAAATELLQSAEVAEVRLEADRRVAEERRNDFAAEVAKLQDVGAFESLVDRQSEAGRQLTLLAAELAEAERNARQLDAAELQRQIASIDKRQKALRERHQNLKFELTRLETLIEAEGGKGLGDRAAEAADQRDAAELAYQRQRREADVLALLKSTLDQAHSDVSRSLLEPIARRAKRHVERLLPGCELSFSEEFGLQSISRNGRKEGCGDLSRGTQEQLAVLTRLGFADMLMDEGRPVSLILDDPLVYSDDVRLERMADILTEAAERMQVIILTCRDRAFRHIGGNQVRIG